MNEQYHRRCGGFPELASAGRRQQGGHKNRAVKDSHLGRRHKKRATRSQDWVKFSGCSVQIGREVVVLKGRLESMNNRQQRNKRNTK
jgi:hypothetical protein